MTALWLTFQSLDSNSERKVVFVSHESFLYLYLSSISNKQKTILVSKSRERKQISIEQTQESLDQWWFTPVVSLDTSRGEFFSERVSILTLWSKTNRSLSTYTPYSRLPDSSTFSLKMIKNILRRRKCPTSKTILLRKLLIMIEKIIDTVWLHPLCLRNL